ncbi:hypothetical protein [Pedobacter sp. Leaf170]|uniref:hypothetical protein n=1 Tax=Pedobacter sp. Leaf170 TaxID=2876558 RepID=UPI001E5D4FE9|nr:hypothetical protein [Pedobacter sp. Leaf170]
MLTILDFSKQLAGLKREKQYAQALTCFRENKANFTKEHISGNEYIISDMISCLRYANRLDAGFQFLSIYEIEISEAQKERVLNAYGWLLWAKYKAENATHADPVAEDDFFDDEEEGTENEHIDFNKSELLEKVETLISILNAFPGEFMATLSSNLFSVVLKSEKKKPAPNWKLVNEFCNKVDREKLAKTCSVIQIERKGQLKDMELASDFENWYAYKTKALTKLREWQECFDLSKEALERIENFHYSNDVWFSRRVALSKRNLGDTKDTIRELQTILIKKREWFIQKELAELYLEEGNIDQAFKQAIDAMNNFGPLEFKVDLLYLLGKIHQLQNKPELSFKHFSLSKLIREVEEWKIPNKLSVELQLLSFPEILITGISGLKRNLQDYWSSFKLPAQKYRTPEVTSKSTGSHQGEIIRILHDNERGKDGFIKSGGREYYFSVSANYHSFLKIEVATKVGFEIIASKNSSKKEQARIKKILQ